jgi:predicted cobalt transporter CbtA
MGKSKAGWWLAALYLVVATLSLATALSCRSSFFCGFAALPALVPAGFLYLWLLADHVPSPAVLQWQVLVPTVLSNMVFFYAAGQVVAQLRQRMRSRRRSG